MSSDSERRRCGWVVRGTELDRQYHDEDWGVPKAGDAQLFEALTLEGAQAGLSWATILKKRDGYRRCFHGFPVTEYFRANHLQK